MFVFMGNRVGSPPSGSGGENEEQSESNSGVSEEEGHSSGGGVQTGLGTAGTAAGAAAGVGSGTPSTEDDAPDDETDEGPGEEEPDYPEVEKDSEDTPPETDVPTDEVDIELGDEDGDGSETELSGEDDDEGDDDFDDEKSDDRLVYGDIVVDRDRVLQDEVDVVSLDRFVVVNLPGVCAYDWKFDDGDTVAERNPHYPPTDDAVLVVDQETLDVRMPSWDEREEDIPVDVLEANGIEYDVFPSLRLKLDEPSHVRDLSVGGDL